MPTYVYKCSSCGGEKEVQHRMSEIANPPEDLLEKITCPFDSDCRISWAETLGMEEPNEDDLLFRRIPQTTNIMGMVNGSSLSGNEKTAAVREERKGRAQKDFVDNIYPTIPKAEQKFFNKKWETQGRTDRIEKAKKSAKKHN
jgi:hypothetical protein